MDRREIKTIFKIVNNEQKIIQFIKISRRNNGCGHNNHTGDDDDSDRATYDNDNVIKIVVFLAKKQQIILS